MEKIENKTIDCDYKTMSRRMEEENRCLKTQLEETQKKLENRIYDMELKLKKYKKENKWLKDIISSILNIR